MNRFYIKCLVSMAVLSVLTLCASCAKINLVEKEYNQGLNLLPVPVDTKLQDGVFELNSETVILYDDIQKSSTEGQEETFHGETLKEIAEFYAQKMRASTGFPLEVNSKTQCKSKKNCIILTLLPYNLESQMTFKQEEGYTLEVMSDNINVRAYATQGLFYGMATLMQLFPAEIESSTKINNAIWTVKNAAIKDFPRFEYRGLMIDVTRHFLAPEELKKQIDMLATFKINRLHLHLSDYQGWRLEIKKYPKLIEIGSKRIDEYGEEYSGFYTQEEMKDIINYAAERQITIIPEFDIPGHSLAMIASYPQLSCTGKQYEVMSRAGAFPVVLCPGKEDMFIFLDNIFKEVAEIFPGKYVHIGGDECPKKVWAECPNCQARIKKENLRATDKYTAEQRLQSYTIERCENMLHKYGKELIGWDEILQGGLAPDAIVMSWRGIKGGIEAAKNKHKVIMTPNSGGMYFDFYQGDWLAEPLAWGGYAPIEKTYSYEVIPEEFRQANFNGTETGNVNSNRANRTNSNKANLNIEDYILGVQGNVWSESIYNVNLYEYRIFPRVLAVAEIGWSLPDKKNFRDFSRRLNNMAVRMDGHGINYHIPLPEQPGGSFNHLAFVEPIDVEFTSIRPVKMVYTLNGRMPKKNSKIYTEPIHIDKDCIINICSVLPSGKMSLVRTIDVKKVDYLENIPFEDGVKVALKSKAVDSLKNNCSKPLRELELELEQNFKPEKWNNLSTYLSVDGRIIKGANLKISEARCLYLDELEEIEGWKDSLITDIHKINRLRENFYTDVIFYVAKAEGMIYIPETGVYQIHSDNSQVLIDDEIAVDNDGQVQLCTKGGRGLALKKGWHTMKVNQINNFIGGWAARHRNRGYVSIKKVGE